ncbi:hypothetical protein [Marinoscillum sp.]|uniref:hypothetical protein n=1 Tax=Marinoscillum sp. TaxID=2024838 RepID=UPI003BAD9415
MKILSKILFMLCISMALLSCEEDEGLLPAISFKTAAGYTSDDVTLSSGSEITIGITAKKTEDKDVLKQFNISEAVNGDTPGTVLTESLSGSDEDNYEYDYTTTVEGDSGDTHEFVFTVSNRDGLVNQVSLVVTIE